MIKINLNELYEYMAAQYGAEPGSMIFKIDGRGNLTAKKLEHGIAKLILEAQENKN